MGPARCHIPCHAVRPLRPWLAPTPCYAPAALSLSDRVAGAGCFGASLMTEPERVAACCAAMGQALVGAAQAAEAEAAERRSSGGAGAGPGSPAAGGAPAAPRMPALSVKCRLGVDEVDSYAQLARFVAVVSAGSPVTHFVLHARKAFLNVGRGVKGGEGRGAKGGGGAARPRALNPGVAGVGAYAAESGA
jgi:hypothetical protein